ncbi:hypothetical protein HZ326_21451 [Fusarium oxysporum f. sp. albedinis]|nr:hypothetical protein HZ326_21451 [Fusarium oxysporum f. sp. albedinis]
MWVTWRKLAHQCATGGRIGSFKELLSLGNSAFASMSLSSGLVVYSNDDTKRGRWSVIAYMYALPSGFGSSGGERRPCDSNPCTRLRPLAPLLGSLALAFRNSEMVATAPEINAAFVWRILRTKAPTEAILSIMKYTCPIVQFSQSAPNPPQHRATELLQELQACLRHISAQPRLINGQPSPISRSSAINQPDTSPSRTRSWICPHPDCARKLKRTSFERRKDLVRHAESHMNCQEKCLFCAIPILQVRKYFTHYDKCPTRLEHQRTGILSVEKDDEMRKKRQDLHENTELWLNRLLPSGASNRAGGRRQRQRSKIPANVVEPSVTRHDAIHTNCHPRPNPGHGAPLPGGNAIQAGQYPTEFCIAILTLCQKSHLMTPEQLGLKQTKLMETP